MPRDDLTGIPLNGSKTHPLTPFARKVLARLNDGPEPRQSINPGVIDRLLRGGMIVIEPRKSPYAIHSGAPIGFAVITDLGRTALATGGGREG